VNFNLKYTKKRLVGGLCPDLLGELKRSPKSPNLLAANGCTSCNGEREGEGKETERNGSREKGRGNGKGRRELSPVRFEILSLVLALGLALAFGLTPEIMSLEKWLSSFVIMTCFSSVCSIVVTNLTSHTILQ